MNRGYLKVLQVLIFNRTHFVSDKGQEFTYSTIIANVKSSMDRDSNCSWLIHVATATCKGWKWGSMKSKVRKQKLEKTSLILWFSTRLVYTRYFKHHQMKCIWFVFVWFCHRNIKYLMYFVTLHAEVTCILNIYYYISEAVMNISHGL